MGATPETDRATRDESGSSLGSDDNSQYRSVRRHPVSRTLVGGVALTDKPEVTRAISAFADEPNGGLILTGSAKSAVHHKLIIELATRHKLPAGYHERFYVADGGLISYGPNFLDQYRQAAVYVDRIFRGEKPGDMPVQAPTKYELIINLHAAKEIGLAVPSTLLAQADEVVE